MVDALNTSVLNGIKHCTFVGSIQGPNLLDDIRSQKREKPPNFLERLRRGCKTREVSERRKSEILNGLKLPSVIGLDRNLQSLCMMDHYLEINKLK